MHRDALQVRQRRGLLTDVNMEELRGLLLLPHFYVMSVSVAISVSVSTSDSPSASDADLKLLPVTCLGLKSGTRVERVIKKKKRVGGEKKLKTRPQDAGCPGFTLSHYLLLCDFEPVAEHL